MNKKRIHIIICVLSALALVVSSIAVYEHHAEPKALTGFCNAFAKTSCQQVQDSVYGTIFGIETALYGIAGFAALLAVTLLSIYTKKPIFEFLTLLGSAIGGIMSLRFLFIQAFVLGEFCPLCVIVDTSGVILFGIGLYLTSDWLRHNVQFSPKD